MEADITSQAVGLGSSVDFSLMSLFLRADIVVKSVIILLIAASIYSWAIIIEKFKMFKKINDENLDILCPDRFINKNSIKSGPFFKFLLAKIVNYSLYYLTDVPTKDATNGFRFFSRRVLETINIESKIGFTYSIEYLLKSKFTNF